LPRDDAIPYIVARMRVGKASAGTRYTGMKTKY